MSPADQASGWCICHQHAQTAEKFCKDQSIQSSIDAWNSSTLSNLAHRNKLPVTAEWCQKTFVCRSSTMRYATSGANTTMFGKSFVHALTCTVKYMATGEPKIPGGLSHECPWCPVWHWPLKLFPESIEFTPESKTYPSTSQMNLAVCSGLVRGFATSLLLPDVWCRSKSTKL